MKRNTKLHLITAGCTIVFAFLYFYFALPAISIHSTELPIFVIITTLFYAFLFKIMQKRNFMSEARYTGNIKFLFATRFSKAVFGIIAVSILFMVIGDATGWKIFNANRYQQLLTVTEGDFTEDVHQINYSNIPSLDSVSASKIGNRTLGALADKVSQYVMRDDLTQINYKGRPVRVTTLKYSDIIKWFNNTSKGIPGYITIDMVTQEGVYVPLEEGIQYTPDEHFGKHLKRHLRFNYPTFIFEEEIFEIDEEGVPYWICPVVDYKIGLYGGRDIGGAVLVNAVTGESEYYSLDEVPTWVDHVFNAELLIEQFDNYGTLQHGFFNSIFGQKDSRVTTDGYNYMALDDDVYMYSGVTSVTGDESNIGFILSNQRTKETKYYRISGAEEYSAMESAEGMVQHLNYTATFPLLLNIGDTPTYFIALKDDAQLVKMYAMVNVSQYQLVSTGSTIKECEENYLQLLKNNNLTETQTEELRGKITDIRSAVIDGNTVYYIKLDSSEKTFYITAKSNSDVVFYAQGDNVKLSYETTASNTIQIKSITKE